MASPVENALRVAKSVGGPSKGTHPVTIFHGGDDFDEIDPKKFGTGEPGGIRPLGRGLYGGLAVHPDDMKPAIDLARVYTKYAKKTPTIHAFQAHLPEKIKNLNYYEGGPSEWTHRIGDENSSSRYGDWQAEALPWRSVHGEKTAKEISINNPSMLRRLGKWPADTPHEKILADLNAAKRPPKAQGGPLDPGHPQREANLAKFQEGNHPLVPSVLYHGTNRDIRAFDLDKPRRVDAGSGEHNTDSGWFGKGIYLTPHKRAASAYASGVGGVTHDEGANVMPVHASLKNPFIVEGLGGRDMDRHLSAAGMKRHPRGWNLPSEQTKWLKGQGHDGVIAHDPKDPGAGMEFVVFHPHQLKSAIGNSGHFDPSTPDITKKAGGRVARAHGGATRIKLHIGPIHSSVAGRTDHLPMHVPSGSYVIPADVVSGHGEGNTIAGFKIMRRVFGGLPYGGARGIYGQGAGPYGEHLATGGAADGDEGVPIVAAGGEYVVSPEEVVRAGDGDLSAGHRALDEFVKQSRANIVKTMSNLPGPKRD